VQDRHSGSTRRLCGEADFAPSAANQASWKLTASACTDNYTAANRVTDSERQQRAGASRHNAVDHGAPAGILPERQDLGETVIAGGQWREQILGETVRLITDGNGTDASLDARRSSPYAGSARRTQDEMGECAARNRRTEDSAGQLVLSQDG
jgi:hypothetical protein